MRQSLQQQKRTQSPYRSGPCIADRKSQEVTVYLPLGFRLNDNYLLLSAKNSILKMVRIDNDCSFNRTITYFLLGINLSAFEVLMEEHAIILRAISVLNQSTVKLKSKAELPSGFFDTFLDVIQKFADKCHHGKEEVVLFPLIKQRSCSQSEIIPELLEDHQRGRDFIAGFREAIASHNYDAMVENADAYSQLLTLHIKRENEVFPLWFRGLGDKDKEDLFERFEEIEEKVIGIGKHEEYIRKIEDLNLQLQ